MKRKEIQRLWIISLWMILLLTAGCTTSSIGISAVNSTATPPPSPTETKEPTPTPADTATPTPTETPTATPTEKPNPTLTVDPGTPTPTLTPSMTPTNTPTPTPVPMLNGVPISELIVIPDNVVEHMREVYWLGRTKGRQTRVFSRLGDSVIATPDFLVRFDSDKQYDLGPYSELQETVDFYAGSWSHYGVAIKAGLSAWGVFHPLWANKEFCEPEELMLFCEFRLNNPSILIINLGTNDVTETYPTNMRRIVEESLERGIMPIIVTKADRFEGEDNRNNTAMREIAEEYEIPLVDFDRIAETLPNRGLRSDDVHMNKPDENYLHDYNDETLLETGHPMHNLLVIMMLNEILEEVVRYDYSQDWTPTPTPTPDSGSDG